MSEKYIPYGQHHIDEEDVKAVVDILNHSHLTQGPAVDMFGEALAESNTAI